MNDYVERQKILDAVEKLKIIPSIDGMGKPTPTEDFRVQFLGTVLKVPAADVVPVVRCKKGCIHNNDCDIQYSAQAGENFFCGFGETEKDVREDAYE